MAPCIRMVRAIRRMCAPPCQCHSRLRVCGWSPAESPRPFGRSAGYHSVPCGCAPLHPQGTLRIARRDVGSLGGRAAAAASVGRFSPSTPQAGSDGWRARAFGEPAGLEIPTW